MFDINHLRQVTLRGENLEALQNNWTNVLSGLKKPPDPDIAQHLYYKHVQHFKPLGIFG